MPRKYRKLIIYIMIAIMFIGTVFTGIAAF
ncbi:stressosome-associated protein Prli42 [Evansella cellulosilytica]|nr:stressosome-associated protein Prli42 [Evansella cellulosilytica]